MDINRLQLFLRVFSLVPMTAVLAAMLPAEVMGRIHQAIGLGRMPEGPIVVYLARSTSLFYALHGILLWYIASDLRRYREFFRFYLRLSLLFAVGLLLTDISAGLPWNWVLAEGPAVAAFLLVLLWLFRQAEARDRAQRS